VPLLLRRGRSFREGYFSDKAIVCHFLSLF
jgi:hypothetical protein